jgi:hypothetical protein
LGILMERRMSGSGLMRMSSLMSYVMYSSCTALFVFYVENPCLYLSEMHRLFSLLYGYCRKLVLDCTVSRPSSCVGLFQMYKMIYLLPTDTKHYKDSREVGHASRDSMLMVCRDRTQSVVTISSSTVRKQLLTVRP